MKCFTILLILFFSSSIWAGELNLPSLLSVNYESYSDSEVFDLESEFSLFNGHRLNIGYSQSKSEIELSNTEKKQIVDYILLGYKTDPLNQWSFGFGYDQSGGNYSPITSHGGFAQINFSARSLYISSLIGSNLAQIESITNETIDYRSNYIGFTVDYSLGSYWFLGLSGVHYSYANLVTESDVDEFSWAQVLIQPKDILKMNLLKSWATHSLDFSYTKSTFAATSEAVNLVAINYSLGITQSLSLLLGAGRYIDDPDNDISYNIGATYFW